MSRVGGEGRAGNDQVRDIVRQRQLVEEPVDHPGPVAVVRGRELPPQELAQRPGGLDRHDLPPAVDELEREPSGARADLGDPLYGARQPPDDAGMQPLGAGQPVVKLRFEPV